MNIQDFYQKLIIDYSRMNENKRQLQLANSIERGHNPSCGDDLTLLVYLDKDAIKDISYQGQGCAMSLASTNMLIELVRNKNIDEVNNILNTFFEMIKRDSVSDNDTDILQDATVLHMAYNMPARIKCVTLSWHTLKILLERNNNESKI